MNIKLNTIPGYMNDRKTIDLNTHIDFYKYRLPILHMYDGRFIMTNKMCVIDCRLILVNSIETSM